MITSVLLSPLSRQRLSLLSLCGGLGIFGRRLSWARCCRYSLGWGFGFGLGLGFNLDLSLDLFLVLRLSLGLCLGQPDTIGHAGTSRLPELGVGNAGESMKLAADPTGNGGPYFLGFDHGLDGLGLCTHGLRVAGLHLFQALLIVLLGKVCVPWELGVHSFKRFVSL